MRISIPYLLAALLVGSLLAPVPQRAQAASAVANGIVGDGTAASCTYTELITEMGAAGYITFACGAAPYTIILAANGGVQPLAGAGTTLDGGGLITLSAANVTNNRLFDVFPTAALTLTHLTLTNATTAAFGGGALRNRGRLVFDDVVLQNSGAQGFWGGGGIYNQAGTLLIRNSTLRQNYSAGGGALYNEVGATATIEGSTFLSNTVTEGAYGGAISNSGLLTVTASSFTGNAVTLAICPSTCGGGAIANLDNAGLAISTTTFARNVASHSGGALFNLGYVWMVDSMLSSNEANDGGGAAHEGDDFLFLTRVSLAGNTATGSGGGLFAKSGTVSLADVTIAGNTALVNGGGIMALDNQTTLTRVTVSGNSAAYGGGIANFVGLLTVVHATLTANSAVNYGGGLYNGAGALLTHVTISGNSAGSGGGIYEYSPGSNFVILTNVLLVGNLPQNCDATPQSPTYSLSTDATCFAAGNGNQVSTPLALGPLANNGGLTLTQLPAPGSAAIDGGSCVGGLLTDQRGLPRLVGAGCDIGAVERQLVDFGWYAFLPIALR